MKTVKWYSLPDDLKRYQKYIREIEGHEKMTNMEIARELNIPIEPIAMIREFEEKGFYEVPVY